MAEPADKQPNNVNVVEPPTTPAEASAAALKLVSRSLTIAQALQGRIARGVGTMDANEAARALSAVTASAGQMLAIYRLLAPPDGDDVEADRPASSGAAQAAAAKLLRAVKEEQLARERAVARKAATTLPAPSVTKQ